MRPDDGKKINAWVRYSSVGFEFAAWIVVCAFAGYYIDQYWQPSIPWGTLGCSLAGIFAGIWRLIRKIDDISRTS